MKYGGKYNLKKQLHESFTGNVRNQYGDDVVTQIAAEKGYTKGAKIGQSTPDMYDKQGKPVESKGMQSGTISIEIGDEDYPALRTSIYTRAKEIADEQGHYGSAIERAVREKVSKGKAMQIARKYFEDNGGTIETSAGPVTINDVEVANSIGGSFGGNKRRSKIVVKWKK